MFLSVSDAFPQNNFDKFEVTSVLTLFVALLYSEDNRERVELYKALSFLLIPEVASVCLVQLIKSSQTRASTVHGWKLFAGNSILSHAIHSSCAGADNH